MAYTVLARKYRSWTFDELVGQQGVATTLKNAISCERIHHGFLFCGTRGVGKTSAARILARSLNCLGSDRPTAHPCLKCESCLAIAEGQDVDVIEIDAASNTGVDNIRELRSNAAYRPARARFKIYIIDEVHMLSTGAFNALLKTLEEPPEHVKFILATTESQKVPATIQSRCLRFDFRSIGAEEIEKHLRLVLKNENIEAEAAVLRRVGRLANGSMRDALSLLDQLLSAGQKTLTLQMIDDMLPTPHDETLLRLLTQIADRDAAGAMASLDVCLSGGYTLDRFAESLAEQVRELMLLRVCGPDTSLVEASGPAREPMLALANRFESDEYVYMIAVLEDLRRNVRYSALGRALVEAAIVRMAGPIRYQSVQALLDQLGGASAASVSEPEKKKVNPPAAAPAAAARGAAPRREERAETSAPGNFSARAVTRGNEAAPAPAPGPLPQGGDLREAAGDPVVRKALELFDGTLVNVERIDKG